MIACCSIASDKRFFSIQCVGVIRDLRGSCKFGGVDFTLYWKGWTLSELAITV